MPPSDWNPRGAGSLTLPPSRCETGLNTSQIGGNPMRTLLMAAAAVLAGLANPSFAQDFPTKPITFVVPFTAGGPTDTVTRLIAESMSKTLGQQAIVQNVTGAGGTLGAGEVAAAPPDG